jgi:hypothetical protein
MKNVEENENALDQFLNITPKSKKYKNSKKVILDEREGLIERVDKVFVTKDGKQLLREQY